MLGNNDMLLTLTTNFVVSGTHERIQSDLSEFLPIEDMAFIGCRSADPPSFIRLLGDAAEWKLILGPPALVYLSTLAKHAGDATWDKIGSLFRKDPVEPLIRCAETLSTAAKQARPPAKIVIGIGNDDELDGVEILIENTSPEEVARTVAVFVQNVENLSIALGAEIKAGRGPISNGSLEFRDDGTLLVRWTTSPNLEHHELVLPGIDEPKSPQ